MGKPSCFPVLFLTAFTVFAVLALPAFAGTPAAGGVWKTTNGATQWQAESFSAAADSGGQWKSKSAPVQGDVCIVVFVHLTNNDTVSHTATGYFFNVVTTAQLSGSYSLTLGPGESGTMHANGFFPSTSTSFLFYPNGTTFTGGTFDYVPYSECGVVNVPASSPSGLAVLITALAILGLAVLWRRRGTA